LLSVDTENARLHIPFVLSLQSFFIPSFSVIVIRQAFDAVKSIFDQFHYKSTYLPCKYAWHIPPSESVVPELLPMEEIFSNDLVLKIFKKETDNRPGSRV
jgi:hypothetical protein